MDIDKGIQFVNVVLFCYVLFSAIAITLFRISIESLSMMFSRGFDSIEKKRIQITW